MHVPTNKDQVGKFKIKLQETGHMHLQIKLIIIEDYLLTN